MKTGCVLGFDFGIARIGIAQGEYALGIAHPLTVIHAENNKTRFGVIEKLINEWQPVTLVVGFPIHLDGQMHEMTQRSQRFARQLHGRFSLPVYLVDERLSSVLAEELLHEAGLASKKQKKVLDAVAAQAILQLFFDNHDDPSLVALLI